MERKTQRRPRRGKTSLARATLPEAPPGRRTLRMGIRSLDDMAAEFLEVAQAIERGEKPKPTEGLYFADMGTLLRTLTPERWRLIGYVGAHGPLSVRALALGLSRDYKNVHSDVQRLWEIGLIDKTAGGICVPYQSIVTELTWTKAAA